MIRRALAAWLVAAALWSGCTVVTDFDGIAGPKSDASAGGGGGDEPRFPRLALYETSNPKSFDDPAFQQQAARVHLSVLGIYPGWENSHVPVEQVVQAVKQKNPDTKLFVTFRTERFEDVSSGNAYQEVIDKLTTTSSWLYQSGTSGAKVLAVGSTTDYLANLTLFTPKDGDGLSFVEWLARWTQQTWYVPSPSLDGVLINDFDWKPSASGDYDRDGTTDGATSVQTEQWYRQGHARYFAELLALAPEKYRLARLSSLGDAGASFAELAGLVHGGLVEDLIGQSYSKENTGWVAMMSYYRKALEVSVAPKLVMFQMSGAVTDYQALRYGLASCLLDDGYFAFNDSDGNFGLEWFDEYDVDLGGATSPPPAIAWSNGVWRRDFEHGIALVNPKGNGAATVALGGKFRRLTGTQDPIVNDGSETETVTLSDRDGLILLR